jgi:hypothetical protein
LKFLSQAYKKKGTREEAREIEKKRRGIFAFLQNSSNNHLVSSYRHPSPAIHSPLCREEEKQL